MLEKTKHFLRNAKQHILSMVVPKFAIIGQFKAHDTVSWNSEPYVSSSQILTILK